MYKIRLSLIVNGTDGIIGYVFQRNKMIKRLEYPLLDYENQFNVFIFVFIVIISWAWTTTYRSMCICIVKKQLSGASCSRVSNKCKFSMSKAWTMIRRIFITRKFKLFILNNLNVIILLLVHIINNTICIIFILVFLWFMFLHRLKIRSWICWLILFRYIFHLL